MAEASSRAAARTAALIAVPVALIAGVLAYRALDHGRSTPPGGATGAGPMPSGTVQVAASSLDPSSATRCQAFVAALPDRLRGLPRRPVSAGAEQNAAFGEPPIVVSCGSPAQPSPPPDAFISVLTGVCWWADDQSSTETTVWHTLDRQAPVTVTVPRRYDSPGQWVQEFSAPLVASVPALARPPAYCAAPATAPS